MHDGHDESNAHTFLTVKELAERWRCTEGNIYNTYKDKGLEPTIVGKRRLLFPLEDIIKYEEVKQRKKLEVPNFDLQNLAENSQVLEGVPVMSKKKLRAWNFGKEGSIYEQRTEKGKIRFKLSYYDSSGRRKQRVAKGAKSVDEARSILREHVHEENQKRDGVIQNRANITFRENAEIFKRDYMMVERGDWKSDSYRLKNCVDHFGDTSLKSITPQDIRKFKQKRIEAGNSNGTINRYLALLKRMFNVAIGEELLTKNPVKKVKFMSEQNTVIERILTAEEEQKLLAECSERLRPIVVMALHTGMRQGELLNLRWRKVDMLAETLTVENTKSGKARVIPMNDVVKVQLIETMESRNGSEWVFPFKSIRTAWENARRRAGLEDLRFHDLRHTFATRLVQSGADIVEVQKLLGHSTLLVTQRYTHACEDGLRRAVRMLDVQPKNEQACSKICSKKIEQPSGDSFTSLESVN